MDNHPLPNRDLDLSDSGSLFDYDTDLFHYVVRITAYDKFSTEELLSFVKAEEEICKYVLSMETTPQVHYHLVLSLALPIEDVKRIIRSFIVPLWSDPTGKCPKGFGNKQYNIQEAEDVTKSISYCLKEATEYHYECWPDDYIQQCKEASFPKKKISNFKVEYQQLCADFQQSHDYTIDQFMKKYFYLKGKYGQLARMSDGYGYALSNLFFREPDQIDQYVDDYLYKVKHQ